MVSKYGLRPYLENLPAEKYSKTQWNQQDRPAQQTRPSANKSLEMSKADQPD